MSGIYVFEDTLMSFKMRLFNSEYTFEIGDDVDGWRCNQAGPSTALPVCS